MKRWPIAVGVLVVAFGIWWLLLDGQAPAEAEGVFDIVAYRALVAQDAQETLPSEIRVEFVAASEAPAFAVEAGAFGAERTLAYTGFQVVSPGGDTIIDAALDQDTLGDMTRGAGRFDNGAYGRLLGAMARAGQIVLTHEHLDHVMGITRHPAPEVIGPRLRLTREQIAALPEHARPRQDLPEEIGRARAFDFTTPQRIAPGVVVAAAPGHSPGSVVIYVRTTRLDYLFIGDIAWMMSNIQNRRGRPRIIGLIIPGVDPDRPTVLRQLRALHDLAAAEPDLVIVPAHDQAYLLELVRQGALANQFTIAAAQ